MATPYTLEMRATRITALLTVLTVSLLTFSAGDVASGRVVASGVKAAADWVPKAPPPQYDPNAGPRAIKSRAFMTDVCTTAVQLDCVESVAAYINDTWVEGVPTDTVDSAARQWTIPGLVNLGGVNRDRVSVMYQINYTGNIFLMTEIRSTADYGDRDEIGVQKNVKFRASVRTSWILPTHVGSALTDAKLTVTKLATSGASKVTMEGVPTVGMVVLDESTLLGETGKGAYETREFSFGVSDGRFYPIKKECIEKPTIMTADNGYGFSLPKFENGNLDLRVTAPHFRSDGVTVHYGVYEGLIPLDTAKCLWGDAITSASEFKVEVVETSGGTKTATRSVNVNSDSISIKASGFTYSSPTIRVTYVAPAAATTSTTVHATTTTVATTAPVSVSRPGKPAGMTAKGAKGSITTSFTKFSGVTYTVTATKGKTKKTLKCTSSFTRMTCTAKSLANGIWKVSVNPSNAAGTGTPVTKTIKVT